MDWGQQRTSEGKLCEKKGSSVLLIWWLGKGKCNKSSVSTEFLQHGMQTLSRDDLSWNVSHDQQQSCDDALTSAWQFLHAEGTLEAAITRSPLGAAVCSPRSIPVGSNGIPGEQQSSFTY